MRLRDEGRLTFDDPILKYVPELRKIHNPFGPVEQITIRRLLSHSAGLRSGTWPWAGGEEWQPFEPPGWEQPVGMWKPVVPVSNGVQMGLTFFLERHGGQDDIAHSGGQNGFLPHFYLQPASGLAHIVAFNTQTTSAKDGDKRNTRALDAAVRDWILGRFTS